MIYKPAAFHKVTALAREQSTFHRPADLSTKTSDKTKAAIHQMKSLTIAVLAAFAAVASAVFSNSTHFIDPATNLTITHFNCGVSRASASQHFNETIGFLHRNTRLSNIGTRAPSILRRQTIAPALSVNLYVHLLTTVAKAGTLTQTLATAQVAAMNKAYSPIGVSFNLINVSTTANDAWAVADGSDMDTLKKALRCGTYSDLNLYFHTDLSGGILGTCTLPSQVSAGSAASQYYSDGCNINANTMPGGSLTGYNQGMTAVHETGHWLGLLHTFEGYACTGDGDSIADTPMQATSTDGCPSKPAKDSCPSATGVDVSAIECENGIEVLWTTR